MNRTPSKHPSTRTEANARRCTETDASPESADQPSNQSLIDRAMAIAEESYLAGTGPGGQNVNKVASAVQLRVNVFALRLSPQVFARLKKLAGSRMNSAGQITLTARSHRSQHANREAAKERLAELLLEAERAPPKRKTSRLNRVGKQARLKAKKQRGQVKANRGKVSW